MVMTCSKGYHMVKGLYNTSVHGAQGQNHHFDLLFVVCLFVVYLCVVYLCIVYLCVVYLCICVLCVCCAFVCCNS
jgi:hypothetical protein